MTGRIDESIKRRDPAGGRNADVRILWKWDAAYFAFADRLGPIAESESA